MRRARVGCWCDKRLLVVAALDCAGRAVGGDGAIGAVGVGAGLGAVEHRRRCARLRCARAVHHGCACRRERSCSGSRLKTPGLAFDAFLGSN